MVLTDEQRELIEKTMLQLLQRKGWFTAYDVYAELEGSFNIHIVIGFVGYHGYRYLRGEQGVQIDRIERINKKTGCFKRHINVYHRKDVSPPDHVEY